MFHRTHLLLHAREHQLSARGAGGKVTRQHKRVITTAGDHDIMYHNHNKNIPCGL